MAVALGIWAGRGVAATSTAAARVRVRDGVLQNVIGSLLAIAYDRIKVADPLPYSAVRILKAEVRGFPPCVRDAKGWGTRSFCREDEPGDGEGRGSGTRYRTAGRDFAQHDQYDRGGSVRDP